MRLVGRLLVALGISAVVVLVIIFITGGFALHAGPLFLSAHNWRGPMLLAGGAFGAVALLNRALLPDAALAGWQFIDDHGLALAVLIAAATAGVGIAYGTYSASSADASGYVSEARLIASARLGSDEPLAREVAWPNATWAFAPLGYRPGIEPGELAPTYPAGLPLAIAPVQLLAGELAGYFVVPFLGAVAVLATYGVAMRLHSRHAGIAAALLLATSPVFLFQIVQPMSDVAVTAWWTVALLCALAPFPYASVAAGAVAGLAVLTRPNLLPLSAVVMLALANWPRGRDERRRRIDRLAGFFAGISPAIGAQLLVQWRLYGNPLASGYGAATDLFGLGNVAPNVRDYARRIVEGETPALTLVLMALVLLAALPRPASAAPRLTHVTALASLAIAIALASYLPYGVFTEWSYLRFLLPAFPLVFALVGAVLVNMLLKVPGPIRAMVFACALATVASFNVLQAGTEQAFNLRRYESRYRLAGRYLDSTLPRDAVVVTSQESGSVRYYAHVPILRWDLLDVDLETAVAALRAIGRYPVLLIEDWELPRIATKYPRSATARLDWAPRAEFGDETRVFLYDPADRAGRRWAADRVH